MIRQALAWLQVSGPWNWGLGCIPPEILQGAHEQLSWVYRGIEGLFPSLIPLSSCLCLISF
jgi:hypothetical protein